MQLVTCLHDEVLLLGLESVLHAQTRSELGKLCKSLGTSPGGTKKKSLVEGLVVKVYGLQLPSGTSIAPFAFHREISDLLFGHAT